MMFGMQEYFLDRRFADAADGNVDDPPEAFFIFWIDDDTEVRENVFDFFSFIEFDAADDDVRNSVPPQSIFKRPRLRVGAVQHREIFQIQFQFAALLLNMENNFHPFVFVVLCLDHRNQFPLRVRRPQRLMDLIPVVLDDGVCSGKNRLCRPIILLKPEHFTFGIISSQNPEYS